MDKILDIEKAQELKAHDEKIRFKIIEIETVKAQIIAQQEYLKALASVTQHINDNPIDFNSEKTKQSMTQLNNMTKQLKSQLSGMSADLRTTKAKGALKNLKYEIDNTKTTIGINGNANSYYEAINRIKVEDIVKAVPIFGDDSPINNTLTNVENRDTKTKVELQADKTKLDTGIREVETQKVDLKVGADTTKANTEITQLQGTAKKVKITVPLSVDTKEAKDEIDSFKNMASANTHSIHTIGIDANNAITVIEALKKPTSSTHTVYVNTIQKHAVGGFIRRQGQLGGYGGGDRVKALLEDGEFVVRKEAVSKLGRGALETINQGEIPKFQEGGIVRKYQSGGAVQGEYNIGVYSTDSASVHKVIVDDSMLKELPNIVRLNEEEQLKIAKDYSNKKSEIDKEYQARRKAIEEELTNTLQAIEERRLSFKDSLRAKMLDITRQSAKDEKELYEINDKEILRLKEEINKAISANKLAEAQSLTNDLGAIYTARAKKEIEEAKRAEDGRSLVSKLSSEQIKASYQSELEELSKLNDKIMDADAQQARINSGEEMKQAFNDSIASMQTALDSFTMSIKTMLEDINKQTRDTKKEAIELGHLTGRKVQKLATGGAFRGDGLVGGYDPTDSDKVNAHLTGGEYVINRTQTDKYKSILHAINNDTYKHFYGGFAGGGEVERIKQTVNSDLVPIILNINGKGYNMKAEENIGTQLAQELRREGY